MHRDVSDGQSIDDGQCVGLLEMALLSLQHFLPLWMGYGKASGQ